LVAALLGALSRSSTSKQQGSFPLAVMFLLLLQQGSQTLHLLSGGGGSLLR